MNILFTGDIHGDFGYLNKIINKVKPDITIQCGDNAYYWGFNPERNIGAIKPQGSKVYLIPGNHEHWYAFEEKVGRNGKDPVEVEKNLFYCPIGSSLKVNNTNILFIGGADSHDKWARTIGVDWFQEELLNQKDLDYILSRNEKFDIIVSHTCPTSFDTGIQHVGRVSDPCREVLDIVLKTYKPERWYFGHWHKYITGISNPLCKWTGLDYAGHGGKWWKVQYV